MIIGISGKIGSGKDTVGSIIKNRSNSYDWEIKKFAGKLKQIVSLLTGIDVQQLELEKVKNSVLGEEWDSITVRQMLQRLGTEALRNNLHQNVHINALYADYRLQNTLFAPNSYPNWIITDVRFENEFQSIKDRNGIIIRVNRDSDKVSDHPSETSLDNANFDYVVDNNGTLEELVKKIEEILLKEKLL